ncbi:sensor histidine kinase [Brevibacterium paucivorans]|uniref:sensor histidine kinase n=1 Tax=Brevibacterium paucivorans TaxID=170994 RepID=UPI0031DDF81E
MSTTQKTGWLPMGVAGRILVASSVLLLGIVIVISTVLYIFFSDRHSHDEEERVIATAEVVATTADLHGMGRARLSGTLSEFKRLNELDLLISVPLNELESGKLSVSDPKDVVGDENVQRIGTQSPTGDNLDDLPNFSPSTVKQVEDGHTATVYLANDRGGTLYTLVPVKPTPPGYKRAVIVAGIDRSTVRASFQPVGNLLIASGAFTFVLGTAAIWLTSRGLKRVTGDYGTTELARLIAYYRSVLEAVNDGLLLVDRNEGIVLYNDPARELLGLPESETSIQFDQLPVPETLRSLIASGRFVRDEIHYTSNRVLLVNQQPAREHMQEDLDIDTWVVTVRDHTELRKLTGELVSIRSFSDSLRSQTHEFANRMHIIASLIETGSPEEALEFATQAVAHTSTAPEDLLGGFNQPVLAALVYTKLAQAKEDNIDLHVDASNLDSRIPGDERDLVTVIGNLLDNAFDAVSRPDIPAERKQVELTMSGSSASGYIVTVRDDGPGIPDEAVDQIFERGWSTKHDGVEHDTGQGAKTQGSRGVGLDIVVQAVKRLGGAIDVDGGLGDEAEHGELRGAEFSVWLPSESDVTG